MVLNLSRSQKLVSRILTLTVEFEIQSVLASSSKDTTTDEEPEIQN